MYLLDGPIDGLDGRMDRRTEQSGAGNGESWNWGNGAGGNRGTGGMGNGRFT